MATTSSPKEVIELVERFDRNRDSYLAGGINGTRLRHSGDGQAGGGRSREVTKEDFQMKTMIAVLLVLFLLSFGQAQQTWTKTYGGWSSDEGRTIQQTLDGGYIVAGYTWSFGAGHDDVYLIKIDASGDAQWSRTYGGTGEDEGWSVRQTSDSGYIVAGWAYFGDGYVYLIKTDASGDTQWTRTYGGGNDFGYSVQQTSDGGYIVVGGTYSFGAGDCDVYLINTNASGDTQWTRTYGGTDDDWGNSVVQTSDGGYIIAGMTASKGAGWADVYLIKTNASGDTQWTRTYGGTDWDEGSSVRQTTDSGYIVAGWTKSFGAGGYDVCLIKTNASGDTQWTRTYGGDSDDVGHSVRQTSDGGYIVAGYTWSFGAGDCDVYLIRTNAFGDTQWTRTYGGTGYDWGNSILQTLDGGYIVAGLTNSFGAGDFDVYLIKTDDGGNTGVEEPTTPRPKNSRTALRVQPNPFSSFAVVPGHEAESFILSDVSGRKVAVGKGDRVGEGLAPGVYFLSPVARHVTPRTRPLRIVKGG